MNSIILKRAETKWMSRGFRELVVKSELYLNHMVIVSKLVRNKKAISLYKKLEKL